MFVCKNAVLKVANKAPIDELEYAFDTFNITDCDEQLNLLAQLIHESGYFKYTKENLNYSAKGLAATWPSRFANKDKTPNQKANEIARNPQLIANAVYNGRLGNEIDSNDGWNYRGRGYIQLTGKDNYKSIGKYLFDHNIIDDQDLFINDPDLVATKKYAALTAVAFWVKNNCWAKNGDIEYITKKINGGKVGLNDRKAIRDRLYQAMT